MYFGSSSKYSLFMIMYIYVYFIFNYIYFSILRETIIFWHYILLGICKKYLLVLFVLFAWTKYYKTLLSKLIRKLNIRRCTNSAPLQTYCVPSTINSKTIQYYLMNNTVNYYTILYHTVLLMKCKTIEIMQYHRI